MQRGDARTHQDSRIRPSIDMPRRGGVKGISGLINKEIRAVLKVFLENLVCRAIAYTEHSRRETVTSTNVVCAF